MNEITSHKPSVAAGTVEVATRVRQGMVFETLGRRDDGQWTITFEAARLREPEVRRINAFDAVNWLRRQGLCGLIRRHFPALFDCPNPTHTAPPDVFVPDLPKGLKGGRGNWENSPGAEDEAA